MQASKKLISTFLVSITLASCNGGGGDEGSSSSSSSSKGLGYFERSAGPNVSAISCFNHNASSLNNTECTNIGGSYNSTSTDQCVGAQGSLNTCGEGSPVTVCRYNGQDIGLDSSYSTGAKTACEKIGGIVVTTCSGVSQVNCASYGGTWQTVDASTCSGYDVSTSVNCSVAGGEFYNSAEYFTGSFSVHPDGDSLKNGNNKVLTQGITDDGSDPTIIYISANVEIVSDDYGTTFWSGPISISPQTNFYGDDLGNIYFDTQSPLSKTSSQDTLQLFITGLYFQ